MRKMLRTVIIGLATGACGGMPTSSVGALSGRYAASILDDSAGAGTAQVTLVESFGALTGTWEPTGGGFLPTTYYVVGSVFEGGEVRFNVSRNRHLDDGALIITDGGCSYRMRGMLQGAAIVGTYETFGCDPQRTGTVLLSR